MGTNDDQAVAWRALCFELARALKCLPSVSVGGNRHVLAAAEEAQAARETRFDLVAHLQRQAAFSARTFGPGRRVEGVTDHIAKELVEVRDSGGALAEWVDVIILALDGAWRSGASPQEIIDAIVAKQSKNEARTWPDWRTADPNRAIEHDRSSGR